MPVNGETQAMAQIGVAESNYQPSPLQKKSGPAPSMVPDRKDTRQAFNAC